jgi:hypothetical protein
MAQREKSVDSGSRREDTDEPGEVLQVELLCLTRALVAAGQERVDNVIPR